MTPIHVRMMAAYGAWMNGRMLELCGTLTDAERKRDLGAFFKSIHGTFDHLVYGDVAWMGRFTGSPMPSQADRHRCPRVRGTSWPRPGAPWTTAWKIGRPR